MMELAIPTPTFPEMTVSAGYWFVLTLFIARILFKGLDQHIQKTGWFLGMGEEAQWIVKRALDLLHHWYIGYGMMVYAGLIAGSSYWPFSMVTTFYIGFAIFLDDLPDVPPRLRKVFEGYAEWWRGEK